MTQRQKIIVILSVASAALLGGLLGRRAARIAVSAPITLRIAFDGGYLFDFDQKDAVYVHALKAANYPMKVRLLLPATGMSDLAIDDYKLSILPDGSTPSRALPGLPPNDRSQTGCVNHGEDDRLKSNNMLFIPDLNEVATRMGTTIKNPLDVAATFELTGGGALFVDHLGGCVQFYDQMDNPIEDLPRRSMASGVGGVVFEWPHIAWNKVVLQRTSLTGGGAPLTTDLTADANNQILLRVSSFQQSTTPTPTAPPPYKIDHFKDHFDGAFTSIDERNRISLWFLETYLVSPGIDCPSGHK